MKARATSYSRDPNRWHEQRARWKRHWESRDARRRPLEQQERDEQNEPPRKSYGKVQVWYTPPGVQVERVNRTRVGRDRLNFVDRIVVVRLVQRRVVVLGIARVAVRTTVVHFLRYRCVMVLGGYGTTWLPETDNGLHPLD